MVHTSTSFCWLSLIFSAVVWCIAVYKGFYIVPVDSFSSLESCNFSHISFESISSTLCGVHRDDASSNFMFFWYIKTIKCRVTTFQSFPLAVVSQKYTPDYLLIKLGPLAIRHKYVAQAVKEMKGTKCWLCFPQFLKMRYES